MTATTAFQASLPAESPKWTALPQKIQSLCDDTNSRFVVPKKVTAFLADIAKGSELINNIAKVFKNVATYHEAVTSDLTSKGIISQLGFFSDVIKTFGFFKGVHAILEKALEVDLEGSKMHQRNLGIASAVFQTIVGGTAGAKVLNTLKLVDLAAFSSSIGAAAVFPFGVFSNALDLVKNIVDLTLNSMKVDDANTKIDATEDNLFATKIMHEKIDPTSNEPVNKKLGKLVQAKQVHATDPSAVLPDVFGNLDAFFTSHLQKMKDKQDSAHTKLTALETEVGTTAANAATALQEYQNASVAKKGAVGFWEKLECNWNKRSARTALVNAKLAHDKSCDRRDQLKAKFVRRIDKHTVWTRAQHMFVVEIKDDSSGSVIKPGKELVYKQNASGNYKLDDANPVNQLLNAERKKWAARDTFWGQEKLKGGISVFINCTVIVCLIAAIVLSVTGVGILALSLTLTSLWLLVSFAGIANGIAAKYIEEQRKEKPVILDYKKISPALLT